MDKYKFKMYKRLWITVNQTNRSKVKYSKVGGLRKKPQNGQFKSF